MRNALLTEFREKEIWNDGYATGSQEAGSPNMTLYRHVGTNKLYHGLYETELVDTKEKVVVYCSIETGQVWVRGDKSFNERFEAVNEE